MDDSADLQSLYSLLMDSAYNDQIQYNYQLTISEFLESMDTKLSWKEGPFLRVFWSHEQSQTQTLSSFSSSSPSSSIAAESSLANKQRMITSHLRNLDVPPWRGSYLLIQFWAATKTDGGECILTTRDQPFALTHLDRGSLEYRKLSLTYTFVVDADEENLQLLGLPGRVFRNKWPEATPDVSYYSPTDYPQRDVALRWRIRSSLALPVFEPSGCDLLGVLELVTRANKDIYYHHRGLLRKITNSKCLDRLYPNILEPASKEIQRALEKVRDAHRLPFAQSWVLGNYSNTTPAYNEIQENRDAMVVTNFAVPGEFNKWYNLSVVCRELGLKKDQGGIVGKALLSHKPCFCKDITQFSMTDYPLAHYARDYCGTVGCFTICLRNFITGNRDYVLEFFLPSLEMGSKDPVTLLNGLLATLKDHFNTFKVASGEELGEELSVQVVKSSIHDESHSFKIGQTAVVQNYDDSDDHSTDDDIEHYYYTISGFEKYMQTRLSCGPRKLRNWVFLTEDDDYPHIPTHSLSSSSSIPEILGKHTEVIQKIAFALSNYDFDVVKDEEYLIQLWAPITHGGRCILKTSGQPFALNELHKGLCAYRKDSLSCEFLVEENGRVEEDQLGIIGRVFRYKWPESTPDVRYYTERRNDALDHRVKGSIAIPVFDSSSGWRCVGVLEIVTTKSYIRSNKFDEAYKVITEITDLKIPPWIARKEMNVTEGLQPAIKEINRVLEVVCERHLLPLVQCWVPWSFSRAMLCGGTRDFLVLTSEIFCDDSMFDGYGIFRKVQGLVGKTLLSHKPCFCRDITQLSLNEYPFSNHARDLELTQCFTICLRSISTGDEDYVLEFFLPPNEEAEDPQILLDSLLATMKENFQSFKVASGEELGEELRVEVYKSLNDNEDKSFRICQPKRSLSQPEAFENEREIMAPDTSDQQLAVEDAIHQDANVFGAEIGGTTCINETTETEPDTSDQQLVVKDAIHQDANGFGAEIGGTTSMNETSETEHEKTVNGISYEDLKQHFGKPLDDVAEIFTLSRSTFKRLCRKLGIHRWQSHKRKTVDSSSSKRQRVGEEPSRRELSCSDMPHMQSTSTVAHTSGDVYPVAVKAKYKDAIIRFELSSSSGMAELEEKVTQRLHLEKGNFSIKYEDDEGEWVLIAGDNCLKTCMDISRSSKKTPIKMSVGPKYSP